MHVFNKYLPGRYYAFGIVRGRDTMMNKTEKIFIPLNYYFIMRFSWLMNYSIVY